MFLKLPAVIIENKIKLKSRVILYFISFKIFLIFVVKRKLVKWNILKGCNGSSKYVSILPFA